MQAAAPRAIGIVRRLPPGSISVDRSPHVSRAWPGEVVRRGLRQVAGAAVSAAVASARAREWGVWRRPRARRARRGCAVCPLARAVRGVAIICASIGAGGKLWRGAGGV